MANDPSIINPSVEPVFEEDSTVTISKENFVVVYRLNDNNSLEFAEYYADKHDIHKFHIGGPEEGTTTDGKGWRVNGQLIGIECSDNEILDTENIFNIEVLTPLKEALNNEFIKNVRNVWGIVLGYNIPGGFNHLFNPSDPDSLLLNIISSTSRLSRINYNFSPQLRNELFNRAIFQRFNQLDTNKALLVFRIDAPTLSLAKQFVDNAEIANKQSIINGIFYLDPYSDKTGTSAEEYENNILDFAERTLPKLNLSISTTNFINPYIDSIIPFVENDSCIWSWFANRASSTFFRRTNSIRTFFYNADFDGGFTMRDIDGTRWPFLAMEAGYLSTAGAMSDPTIEGFLDPKSFYETLFQGATIGEALLFSSPFLDWTITFFGDPLVNLQFPVKQEIITLVDENETWRLMQKNLARAMSYLLRKENEIIELRQTIVDTQDLLTEVALLNSTNILAKKHGQNQRQSELSFLIDKYIEYPERRNLFSGLSVTTPGINDYLQEKEYKISKLLNDSIKTKNIIDSSNLFDEGYWEIEFPLLHYVDTFAFYNFRLEVADSSFSNSNLDTSGTNIIFDINSENGNTENWFYEKEENEFFPLLLNGIPSNFKNRRIKYISKTNQYLTRSNIYYFRVTQIYDDGEIRTVFPFRIFQDIIWT